MILAPHLTIHILTRGGGGAPLSTLMWAESALVARGLKSYEHTIAANYGFESLRLDVACDLESALPWLDLLGVGVLVTSPDATTVWEGHLVAVDLQAGQEKASVALGGMGNRVKARYTTYLGTPGVSGTVSDTESQSLYGIKDYVVALGTTTSAAATNAATQKLAAISDPVAPGSSDVSTGAGVGEITLSLYFEGWYGTLDWVVTSSTSTSTTSTTTQVGSLLSTLASTNPFISTATTNIAASGNSDVEFIAPDTPYREKIETLLAQGTSAGVRLVWGVYELREFYVEAWAGSIPTAIDYQREAGEAVVRNKAKNIVPWWEVRPNKMYQRNDLLDVGPSTGQADTAGRFAIERVTCHIEGDTVTLSLEAANLTGADAIIARLGN